MRKGLVVLALVAAMVAQAGAVGTLSVISASTNLAHVRKYTLSWTSTAGGAVSGNTFTMPHGRLLNVKFIPGSGGTQPTDLYDVTFVDTNSIDYLSGTGANLSNATSTLRQWDPPLQYAGETMDLVVANAGDSKTGTVEILMEVR